MFTSLHEQSRATWIRRGLLASVLVMLAAVQVRCSGGGDGGTAPPSPTNTTPASSTAGAQAIARENAQSGTSEWRLNNPAGSGQLAAYSDRESYPAGSDVRIAVSANPAGPVSWKVFRMGGYRGLGGRLYTQGGPVTAPTQPAPTYQSGTGLVVANWPATFSIATRQNDGTPWLTGVYLVLIADQNGRQTYATFILRDDTRHAEVAVHLGTATWHAYNDFGGESLYVSATGLGHARKVSMDRPITLGFGSGKFLPDQHEGVIWLENEGYDVEYFATSDVGGATNRLGSHRLYLSIGHDEYTTMATLDRLEALVAGGTSLAFLTGNTMVYQIRYEDNERTIVGYKADLAGEDPMRLITPRLTSTRFRDPIVNRPENAVVGVMSDESHNEQPADWIVANANHWVYANTGLANGSVLPDLVFYEWDSLVDNGATPPGITVLASSVVPNSVRPGSRHEATIYERDRAFVFAAGTIRFTEFLRRQAPVAQMMRNLLTRGGASAYRP